MSKLDIPIHGGIIIKVNHTGSKVSFDSGEKIEKEKLHYFLHEWKSKIQVGRCIGMTQLSNSYALKLLEDRVEFKLYAAEQELDGLREYENTGFEMSSSYVTRITWEMKIEYLLAHLVGSVDASDQN